MASNDVYVPDASKVLTDLRASSYSICMSHLTRYLWAIELGHLTQHSKFRIYRPSYTVQGGFRRALQGAGGRRGMRGRRWRTHFTRYLWVISHDIYGSSYTIIQQFTFTSHLTRCGAGFAGGRGGGQGGGGRCVEGFGRRARGPAEQREGRCCHLIPYLRAIYGPFYTMFTGHLWAILHDILILLDTHGLSHNIYGPSMDHLTR